jgi:hypothetical protein
MWMDTFSVDGGQAIYLGKKPLDFGKQEGEVGGGLLIVGGPHVARASRRPRPDLVEATHVILESSASINSAACSYAWALAINRTSCLGGLFSAMRRHSAPRLRKL